MKIRTFVAGGVLLLGGALLFPGQRSLQASSHREAPFVTKSPKIDGTDFYLFNSYEAGRSAYVTILANYLPLQDAYGGPNYFSLDPEALYEIHVDNNGDAIEDVTFQFEFDNTLANGGTGFTLPVGPAGSTVDVAVPFINLGGVTTPGDSDLNVNETYTVKIVRGDRRTGTPADVTRVGGGSFIKPVDNIGSKSLPDYAGYAQAHVYDVTIPGCTPPAGTSPRVFVGQRLEGFAVNLGQIFDLVNMDLDPATPQADPIGARDQGMNTVANKNVTTIALEVPASCLNDAADTVFGAWTTASVRQARVINPTAGYATPSREGGPWAQVSRLGLPLVNEVVIGVKDKDLFNSSEPKDDPANYANYVTNPTVPEVFEILFGALGVQAPNAFPRSDLIAVFLTGVTGVNGTAPALGEMTRLNTGIPATPAAMQSSLGAAACFDHGTLDTGLPGCDPAGFPNGRRPGDDTVDVVLRVAMGYLLPAADAPAGQLPFTDGALVEAAQFDSSFPYLRTPYPGAP